MTYRAVIGMEVHAELKTASKMFCSCPNGLGEEREANIHICVVCTGQPGALPTPNAAAIESVQRAGAGPWMPSARTSQIRSQELLLSRPA
ncbi:MAG: hypothetical protein WDN67_05545 [Candidatus Moraniibacteriota bacterium]